MYIYIYICIHLILYRTDESQKVYLRPKIRGSFFYVGLDRFGDLELSQSRKSGNIKVLWAVKHAGLESV